MRRLGWPRVHRLRSGWRGPVVAPRNVSTAEVLQTLDEWRGEWPNADR